MYCFKCGKEVLEGSKFCTNCGADLTGTANNISTPVNNNPFSYGEEEELLRAYVGDKYEKFISGGFNIWALLIPTFYTLYRKCYLYFFLFFIIPIIPVIGWIATLVYVLVLAINFNNWYLKKAKEDISIIKRTNPGVSTDQLKELAAKKGGITWVGPVIYGVIMIMIIGLIIYLFVFIVTNISDLYDNSYFNKYFDEYSEYFDDYLEDSEEYEDEYATGVNKGKIVDLYYNLPIEYNLERYEKDTIGKYYYNYSNNSSCRVEMTYVDKSEEEYMDSIEIDRNKWVEESIVGNAYKQTTLNTVNGDINIVNYYYVINKYNKTYTLVFSDNNDIEEKCGNIRNNLLQQVRFNHNVTVDDLNVA